MPKNKLAQLQSALEAGESEAIHRARKLSRQAETQLKLAGEPKKARADWQALRRAAAPLRDHDVTGAHLRLALQALPVTQAELRTFEQAWQVERQALVAALSLPPMPTGADPRAKHLKKMAHADLPRQAHLLRKEGADVLKTKNSEDWHEWRKDLKFFRYTLEVLGEPPQIVKQSLEALGHLQDAETVLAAVTAAGWAYGHAEELTAQAKDSRRAARKQVRQLWPDLKGYLKGIEKGK